MACTILQQNMDLFKSATEEFHETVDLNAVERLQNQIQKRRRERGTVYLSGVGKSMNLASHIADMLKSIGIKAIVIDATKAMHGDSGMIDDKDLLLCFSKSGGTKEVVRLVRQLEANGNQCRTCACVCNPKCDLVRYCHDAVVLPQVDEVDRGWNLVPTVSSSFFLNLGNLLISSLLLLDNYQLSEYHKGHPGGAIGKTAAARTMSEQQRAQAERTMSSFRGTIEPSDGISWSPSQESRGPRNQLDPQFDFFGLGPGTDSSYTGSQMTSVSPSVTFETDWNRHGVSSSGTSQMPDLIPLTPNTAGLSPSPYTPGCHSIMSGSTASVNRSR